MRLDSLQIEGDLSRKNSFSVAEKILLSLLLEAQSCLSLNDIFFMDLLIEFP